MVVVEVAMAEGNTSRSYMGVAGVQGRGKAMVMEMSIGWVERP